MSKMSRFNKCGLLLVIVILFSSRVVRGQEVEFCLMPLSEGILQAHASFSAVYQFDVDQKGVPANIKPITKAFTDPAEVEACLQKWSLPQSSNKHLTAVFEWQHGIGWTKLSVSGPDIKLIVHLSGQRCPYRPAALDGGPDHTSEPRN
jgi:hypothetical protein